MSTHPMILETLVDFVDDAIAAKVPITADHIDALVRLLKQQGVQRVVWIDYGEARGGWRMPTEVFAGPDAGAWGLPLHNYRATINVVGHPLRAAVAACRRHGLGIYACFKPYEQGVSALIPDGSPLADRIGLLPHLGGKLVALDPFVAAHPELRVRRRRDDSPYNVGGIPVRTIRLVKSDDRPTRITRDHLQIWTSEHNWQYTRLDAPFDVEESVESCPHEVINGHDQVVTRQGRPRRVLTVRVPDLLQKYILVTTDFTDGPPDFANAGTRIMEALGPDGRVIPGVFANEASFIYQVFTRDFRKHGLSFDNGWGDSTVQLDTPNVSGCAGMIAYTRGRNEFLPACLCESEPAVVQHWLRQLDDILSCGVDGVDFREENHCTHTDYSWDYGYNDVVLRHAEQFKSGTLEERIATARGVAYTRFLAEASRRIRSRGARARIHLNVDWHRKLGRPACRALAYPGHMDFPWQEWIDDGLFDDVTLRAYHYPFTALFDDPVAKEMMEKSQARGLPIFVPRYIQGGTDGAYAAQYERVRRDGRFAGFQVYEVQTMLTLNAAGQWQWNEKGHVSEAVDRVFAAHRG